MPSDPDDALPPAIDPGVYKPQAGDKGLVLRLGDCRLCQHRTTRGAELVLVQTLNSLWSSFASQFNDPHPLQARTLPLEIPTPTAFRPIMQKLGWVFEPQYIEASSWLPQGWHYTPSDQGTWPDGSGPIEGSAKYSIDAVAQTLLAGIVYKIHLWRRTKQQQADCCKDKVLRQLPGSRKNVWVPTLIFPGKVKKKIRTNPRRKFIPPNISGR